MSRDTNKELEMLSRVHEPLDVFFLRRRGGGVLVCLRAAARVALLLLSVWAVTGADSAPAVDSAAFLAW